MFSGSTLPPGSSAALYRGRIVAKLDAALSVQRIRQDLVEEHGFGYDYETLRFTEKRISTEKNPCVKSRTEFNAAWDILLLHRNLHQESEP